MKEQYLSFEFFWWKNILVNWKSRIIYFTHLSKNSQNKYLPIEIKTYPSNLITGRISTSYSYYGRISTSSSYCALKCPLHLFFYHAINLGILISGFFIVFHLLRFKKLLALFFLDSVINMCFFFFFWYKPLLEIILTWHLCWFIRDYCRW